jgi:4-hydroxy 2-oxovalerate aldolase
VNGWEFGHDTLTNIFERLVSTNVEIIEVGFLDERRSYDINRSILPDTASVEKTFGKIDKGNALIVGMIDFGTCGINHLQPCAESFLDGIRVIFKKQVMHEAIAFCKQIKALGYQVFTQAVSITSYDDNDLLELISLVNGLRPFAVSIVDTYGLLHQDNLMHVFHIMDKHLHSEIAIGYHAHNNFQMGYANCIEFLNTPTERSLLVDGTLYGMGKSAGNAPIELLAMYMNRNCGKRYDINQMLEAIETGLMDIYQKVPWGYNLFYYISASQKCHPSYVSYLLNKHTLSIKSVNDILCLIDNEKKLLYDQRHIEELYLEYQKTECDDTLALERLKEELGGKRILLVGPGKSIVGKIEEIQGYIREKDPVVIPINYLPSSLQADYLFLSNSKRYLQMSTMLNEPENKGIKIISTSNVTNTRRRFSYELNYSSLIDERTEVPDNSLVMLLKLCSNIGITDVALAGFDGYSETEMNYFNTNMEYSFSKPKARYFNRYVHDFLQMIECNIQVTFVTKSLYQEQQS